MSVIAPEDMVAEARKARLWKMAWSTGGLGTWLFLCLFVPYFLWFLAEGPSRTTILYFWTYLEVISANPIGPLITAFGGGQATASPIAVLVMCLAIVMLCGAMVALGWRSSPYRDVVMLHGDAAWAQGRDLDRMDAARQVGPAGKYLHLGYGPDGRRISLIETLSVLCIAPPGTGKTTRLVITGLLTTDACSFLVHDPKPELWELCSGWRARLGPTFRLDWSRSDRIDREHPERSVWNPKFNFLDRAIMPPPGPQRDIFLDTVVKVLLPPSKGGGGNNEYFNQKGQSAMMGFLHYIIASVNDRLEADPEADVWSDCDLPEYWRGKPASFPMMVDWMAHSQMSAREAAGEDAPPGGAPPGGGDPLRPWLEGLVRTATEREYPPRCVRELAPIVDTAPQERSGFLGTVDKGLAGFKIESVSERTESSDFTPTDLRGRLSESALKELRDLGVLEEEYPRTRADWERLRPYLREDHWQPVTVMVCINQADTAAFSTITSLFFEIISKLMISVAPNEWTDSGVLLGPYPVCFLLDEFPKMSRCDGVIMGPDLGRSKKTFYVLIAQDINQIQDTYSKEHTQTIVSSTAVKFVLPVNSTDSAKLISDMVGKVTVRRSTLSRQTGLKQQQLFGGSKSEQVEGVAFLGPHNLMSMPPNTHVLVVQGFINRPIRCMSALSFLDPQCKERAYSTRGPTPTGVAPAPELPPAWRARRLAMLEEEVAREREATRAREAHHRFVEARYRWPLDKIADTPGGCP